MKNRKLELIQTADGSHSLYVPHIKETYHSFHGAVQESRHVFIQHGLDFFAVQNPAGSIKILELGLGTGLNALLVAEWSMQHKIPVQMDSLEAYPVEEALALKLNYLDFVEDERADNWFRNIHQSRWGVAHEIHDIFYLKKVHEKMENTVLSSDFDLVFFDAFAPSKQAELWEITVLEKTYNAMKPSGIFVTYCAKGQLKRDLKAIGFEVETLPGPPGKKEMIRAVKL